MAWLSANGRGDVGSPDLHVHEMQRIHIARASASDTADLLAGNSTDLSIEARPMRPTAPSIDVVSTNGDVSK